ncbi:MAG: EamA family transporter [Anaerolineales bacterium]|nr:EamA family transporter [Anaerolineales bacterium]
MKILIPPRIGIFFGILASSTAAIFIRYAQDYAPSLVIAAFRLSFASLILVPFVLTRKRREIFELKLRYVILSAIAGIFLALHFATWISSLDYTSVASSVVLVSIAPLFVALLSPLLLNEPINRNSKYGLLLSLIGIVLIGLSDACYLEGRIACPPAQSLLAGEAIKGDLLAIAGAITVTGYMLIGRSLRNQLSLLSYISLAYGTAAVVLVVIAVAAGLPFTGYPPIAYLLFLLLALIPQLIGHTTINWALRFLPAVYVAIALLLEPVASSLWAYIFLGERPSWLMLIGAVLVLCGVGIASLPPTTQEEAGIKIAGT